MTNCNHEWQYELHDYWDEEKVQVCVKCGKRLVNDESIAHMNALESQLASRDALIERLVHYGNILAAMTFPNKKDDFENTQIKIWYSLRDEWQAMKGGEK